jgi:hypothetical protein
MPVPRRVRYPYYHQYHFQHQRYTPLAASAGAPVITLVHSAASIMDSTTTATHTPGNTPAAAPPAAGTVTNAPAIDSSLALPRRKATTCLTLTPTHRRRCPSCSAAAADVRQKSNAADGLKLTFQSVAFDILHHLPEPDIVSAWDGEEVSGRRKNPVKLTIFAINSKNGHTFLLPTNVPKLHLAAALES